jgi:hypothetical protein
MFSLYFNYMSLKKYMSTKFSIKTDDFGHPQALHIETDSYDLHNRSRGRNVVEVTPAKPFEFVKPTIAPLKHSVKVDKPVGFNPYVPLTIFFFITAGLACNDSQFLQDTHVNCNILNGESTCSAVTDAILSLDSKGSSICLNYESKSTPFTMDLQIIDIIGALELNSMYYTSSYTTNVMSACICDALDIGEVECDSCNTGHDVSLCDSDETGWTINYPSTTTYCSSHNDNCGFDFSKVYTDLWYTINKDKDFYNVLYSNLAKLYVAVQVKITDSNGERTCNDFISSEPTTICNITVSLLNNPFIQTGGSPINLAQSINTSLYYYPHVVNNVGQPNSCNVGAVQMPLPTSDDFDSTVLWGQICTPSNIVFVDGGITSCGSYQQFQCCDDPLDYMDTLPIMTQVGQLKQTMFHGQNQPYFEPFDIGQIQLNVHFDGNYTFSSMTTPVCPTQPNDAIVTGCYNCNGTASFIINLGSSCGEGVAQVSCDSVTIHNPTISLLGDAKDFYLTFNSPNANVDATCKVKASTTKTFRIGGTLVLATDFVDSGTYNQYNTSNSASNNSNKKFNHRALIASLSLTSFVAVVIIAIVIALCLVITVCTMKPKLA